MTDYARTASDLNAEMLHYRKIVRDMEPQNPEHVEDVIDEAARYMVMYYEDIARLAQRCADTTDCPQEWREASGMLTALMREDMNVTAFWGAQMASLERARKATVRQQWENRRTLMEEQMASNMLELQGNGERLHEQLSYSGSMEQIDGAYEALSQDVARLGQLLAEYSAHLDENPDN